jgi:hypothetical protein
LPPAGIGDARLACRIYASLRNLCRCERMFDFTRSR